MVVERLKSCDNIVALAQELGLHRRLLYKGLCLVFTGHWSICSGCGNFISKSSRRYSAWPCVAGGRRAAWCAGPRSVQVPHVFYSNLVSTLRR